MPEFLPWKQGFHLLVSKPLCKEFLEGCFQAWHGLSCGHPFMFPDLSILLYAHFCSHLHFETHILSSV